MTRLFIAFLCLLLSLSAANFSHAQYKETYSSADIYHQMLKLRVLGSVLYVAAHPDDENTRLIAWLANKHKVNTAYFSFTRGDGGQNLIGPEIRDELGVIRTQELLAARRIDHGEQFFSRAVDFGYSKHPDETFNVWDKDQVLADLVWAIRTYKPDVIINRFNTVPGTTHGHHTASALLAHEAIDLAADPKAYPEQLKYADTWKASTLYWNAYFWRRDDYQKDTTELIRCDVGEFDPVLGISYSEMAAEARSQHRCQGFGSTGSRGEGMDFLQYEKGDKPEKLFGNTDLSWQRVKGGTDIQKMVDEIIAGFKYDDPAASVSKLVKLRAQVSTLEDPFWKKRKLAEIDELIYACAGLYLETISNIDLPVPGQQLKLKTEVINRSNASIQLISLSVNDQVNETVTEQNLGLNDDHNFEWTFTIPKNQPFTQPFWLQNEPSIGMYKVDEIPQRIQPENGQPFIANYVLAVEGQKITFKRPVYYKENDPVLGETYRTVGVVPPVFLSPESELSIFGYGQARTVRINVKSHVDGLEGKLRLNIPAGWKCEPAFHPITTHVNGIVSFDFEVTAPKSNGGDIHAVAQFVTDEGTYENSVQIIDYVHIPRQIVSKKASARFVVMSFNHQVKNVGYIMGAGDKIPDVLSQIGYNVSVIPASTPKEELAKYDAILTGIRAYNTVDELEQYNANLLEYVKDGGTLITQYNTSHALVTNNFSPYPIQLSRDRITVEQSPVKMISPQHKLLSTPNKITDKDFDQWVQERGLYFPGTWDEQYQTIIAAQDPGEGDLNGGILYAPYGKGHYIYTSYSWFRQLPAGVPGAIRIFGNLIDVGK